MGAFSRLFPATIRPETPCNHAVSHRNTGLRTGNLFREDSRTTYLFHEQKEQAMSENAMDMTESEYRAARRDMLRPKRASPKQEPPPTLEATIRTELKKRAEAAGCVNLGALDDVEVKSISVSADGAFHGLDSYVGSLIHDRPELFTRASSSSAGNKPAATPQKGRRATEMDPDEYLAARADLIKRRR